MTTLAELKALHPDAEVSPSCQGEIVIYTGLRLDPLAEDGPLIAHECPSCFSEDPDEDYDAATCEDTWHAKHRRGRGGGRAT